MRTDGVNQMTVRQNSFKMTGASRGFSMLDVLVAIVVLATGLLALAALQGALTRNGADARARSQMAAYTESLVDRMRFAGYTTAAPSTTFAAGDTITPSSSCSGSLTLKQTMQCDANTVQNAAGVSNLTTTITTAQLYCGTEWKHVRSSKQLHGESSELQAIETDDHVDRCDRVASLALHGYCREPGDSRYGQYHAGQLDLQPADRYRPRGSPNRPGIHPWCDSDCGQQHAGRSGDKPETSRHRHRHDVQHTDLSASASSLGGNIIAERVDTKVIQCGCGFAGATGVGITADNNLGSTSGGNSAVSNSLWGRPTGMARNTRLHWQSQERRAVRHRLPES